MAVKASIAIMLLRLVVKPAHRYIVWASIVLTEVYSLAFFLLFIFPFNVYSLFNPALPEKAFSVHLPKGIITLCINLQHKCKNN